MPEPTTARERPILFSGPMVKAIIAGTKTQTRRIVKPPPPQMGNGWDRAANPVQLPDGRWCWVWVDTGIAAGAPFRCPYGMAGNRQTCVVHGGHGRANEGRGAAFGDSGVAERRLQGRGRRPDLLTHEVCRLRSEGTRQLVSAERPCHDKGIPDGLAVPQQPEGDGLRSPVGVHGVSWITAEPNAAGAAFGRGSREQHAVESGVGDPAGELAGQEGAWAGLRGRETPLREVDRRGAGTSALGNSDGTLFATPRSEGLGVVPINGLGDCTCKTALWVRETWAPHADEEETCRNYSERMAGRGGIEGLVRPEIFYRADDGDPFVNGWRPSIFMPRWASRLTLEVLAVRVQRLQEISEADAQAEGVDFEVAFLDNEYGQPTGNVGKKYRGEFLRLWDEINGKRASWASNPWVWVVTFKRLEASDAR